MKAAQLTGPEHFLEAEKLVKLSLRQQAEESADDMAPLSALTMAQAQVHATLALAAAQALPAWTMEGRTADQWVELLGTHARPS